MIHSKVGAGVPLLAALLCRSSRFFTVDANATVVLQEAPADLIAYFRCTRFLVEVLVSHFIRLKLTLRSAALVLVLVRLV